MAEPTITNWIDEEAKQLDTTTGFTGEKLPSLKFEPNKITEFDVDIAAPFQKWTGQSGTASVTKAIIPVTHEKVRKNLWLNVKNPLYKDIIHGIKAGKTHFKVVATGTQKDTKYNLVE